MEPQFLKIPCSSNSDFGDLQDCTAFVSLDMLKEIQTLMKEIRQQRPHSTVLQEMSKFSFSDQPDGLLEFENLVTSGETTVAEEFVLVESFEDMATLPITVWNSDLEIIYIGETLAFQYRMEIKHCDTVVLSALIEENILLDIVEEWEQLIQDDDDETEKILDNDAAWNGRED